MQAETTNWLETAERILTTPLVRIAGGEFTLLSVIYFVVLISLLLVASRKIRSILLDRLLPRSSLDVSAQRAVATVTNYLVLLIGMLIVLQTVGVDLTTLNVLAGAVGIGVGFGLQNVASNFISGLIILFERPIKIGDRIEVGDVQGDVIEIGARSTTVLTNDNIAIIVPNSKFITENVINWKHRDPKLRFRTQVSVAYGSDVRMVRDLLLQVARSNPDVLDDPGPSVQFTEFGDNGLNFVLLVWTGSMVHRRGTLISALNFGIYEKFAKHKIEIPFPQRDLHLRSGGFDKLASGQTAASTAESAKAPQPRE